MKFSNPEHTIIDAGDGRFIPCNPSNMDYASLLESGASINPYAPPPASRRDVDAERNRRTSTFTFSGVVYQLDEVAAARIDKARVSALAAVLSGKAPGDLKWADPDVDFGWIAADNTFNTMDAHATLAFGNAAASWAGRHIISARVLKNMSTIPADYTANKWWP